MDVITEVRRYSLKPKKESDDKHRSARSSVDEVYREGAVSVWCLGAKKQ